MAFVLTIDEIGPGIFGATIEGMPDFLEQHGLVGKTILVGCLEAAAQQINYGPTILPASEVLQ